MNIYNIKSIRNMANDSESFYSFFLHHIQTKEFSCSKALDILRVSGIFMDKTLKGKSERSNTDFEKCIAELVGIYPESKDLIREFESQCALINHIKHSFYRAIQGKNIWNNDSAITHSFCLKFILFSEVFLSTISAVSFKADLISIKKIFPFFVLPVNIAEAEGFDIKSGFGFDIEFEKVLNRAYDEIVAYVGKIYCFLNQPLPLKLNSRFETEDLLSMGKLFDECNILDSLERIIDFFIFNNASITKLDNDAYSCDVNEDCLYKDFEVARNRLMMRSQNLFLEARIAGEGYFNLIGEFKRLLPNYLTDDGFYNSIKFSELENSSPFDLYEKYGEIPVYDWIHAYQCLVEISKDVMERRYLKKKSIQLDVHNWFVIKSYNQWILFFTKKGLSVQTARIVIKYFTFDKNAKDLNDCPFISCDEGLLLMPSLVFRSSPINSLMSLFGAKKIDTTVKGEFHERQFLQLVLESGVQACHLHSHEDYECDCVILLDEHLVFIELKSNGQPVRFEKYYQHVCNTVGEDAFIHRNRKNKPFKTSKQQINRVADFYLKNISEVIKIFGLHDDWRPLGVYKMVVSTTVLGGVYHDNDVFFIDKFSMASFFRRSPGKIYKAGDGERSEGEVICGYEHCVGEITIDKLISYVKSFPSVSTVKKYLRKLTYNVRLGNVLVYYPYYDSWPTGTYVRKQNDD